MFPGGPTERRLVLKQLKNGVPIDVQPDTYVYVGRVPQLTGDICEILIGRRYVQVQLLRGRGQKRYLVHVPQFKKYLKELGDRQMAALREERTCREQ